ncbi:hypothetical protein O181_071451 [Austropuccinia psidii MF-1]|uniref:Uncharacterized protein n=1 Tax=Austropuccinia psidii MF-1 TaxID=1389203 RepID=A0A9Q3F0R7_9BASI|nr:hypothetical protein [Austropuccinia psidii MF-1]
MKEEFICLFLEGQYTPFFADNGIRLEHSQEQGEIVKHKETDGRKFFIPICSPETKGWHINPLRGMGLCNATQIADWKINNTSNIRRFQELTQGDLQKNKNQVLIKPNTEVPIKNSKAEVTSNVFKMRKINLHLNYPQASENTHSSKMEVSTSIEVELVQNEVLKPKQLVNSVSPMCGKNGFHVDKKQKAVSEV